MKQRWSKKQVQEKVDMFTIHADRKYDPSDERALHFFTEKLNVMEVKGTKSITLETEEFYNF